MDALSDVLRVVHLTGGVFLHAEFCAPWCIAVRVAPEDCAPLLGPVSHLIPYHYVVEGELHVRVEGEEAFGLRPGEVVLVPHNDQHLLGSALALPPVLAGDIIQPPRTAGSSRSAMAVTAPRPAWYAGVWAATAPRGTR